jgi:hypothetical protein
VILVVSVTSTPVKPHAVGLGLLDDGVDLPGGVDHDAVASLRNPMR